jgi:hypothetical protein
MQATIKVKNYAMRKNENTAVKVSRCLFALYFLSLVKKAQQRKYRCECVRSQLVEGYLVAYIATVCMSYDASLTCNITHAFYNETRLW